MGPDEKTVFIGLPMEGGIVVDFLQEHSEFLEIVAGRSLVFSCSSRFSNVDYLRTIGAQF